MGAELIDRLLPDPNDKPIRDALINYLQLASLMRDHADEIDVLFAAPRKTTLEAFLKRADESLTMMGFVLEAERMSYLAARAAVRSMLADMERSTICRWPEVK